ncbi:cytidyltransferase-related domain protein [Salinarchaeum sp. Harcht-Bsk1]|uniref:adenylyltransferase/cytidyltransferase family protein n=1 Tax=Salinarchaeum sp. Harcht-Bsk1 TaxID=1333523 RepID=UPI0003422C7E|nr:adenylyltransferase/cytidyltransferase family protein [Salinarchaeum sp. Harcht-Bsk1]AGM99965.1 cytidyltransferase-related domain protein [Salinarchaeum sp. Harcht-Bsk1]
MSEDGSSTAADAAGDRRVVAQGTFDILHPGHVHYLEEAASFGDELYVIVARDANVSHKPTPIIPETQRRDLIDALAVVDHAILGDPDDIFVPIERIDPAVIVLGHDQHHDESSLEAALEERGLDCSIERASPRPQSDSDELLSTGRIIEKILRERS